MKNTLVLIISLFSMHAFSQSIDDFPWAQNLITDDNCCAVSSVLLFERPEGSYLYVEPDADCGFIDAKLYFEDGGCWCENWGDFDCLSYYGFNKSDATILYNCENSSDSYNVFDQYTWLNSIYSEENCCAQQEIKTYNVNGATFIYIGPDPMCSDDPGTVYFEDGTEWCRNRDDLSCEEYYSLNASTLRATWTCGADNGCPALPWCQDLDGDGLGNPEVSLMACEQPEGYVADCSDTDDGCVGVVDACGVCNGSGESTWCQDLDGDGLGNPEVSVMACEQPDGYVADCSDDNDTCTGVVDACGVCNGIGETTWCQDLDGDGLGNPDVSVIACEQPEGYVADCSDSDDSCSGVVDACGVCGGTGETTWCQDLDGDGLGNPEVSVTACEQPEGYVADCSDSDDSCSGVVDACGVCDGTGETTWCQDLDGDGLGNPEVSVMACEQPDGYVADCSDSSDVVVSGLHGAFAEFASENVTIYLDGNEVVIESNGLPNHTSPYWSNTTERSATDPRGNVITTTTATVNHPLFAEPTVTSFEAMAPGNIDDFNGSYTLRVPVSPELAPSSSTTGLGSIGIAVSGSTIYNDEEGPNVPLDDAVPSLDYTAAHTGPQSYHYHLEPKAWSNDDDVLIGIIADGFFIYGRKCASTGTYPTDLDESGGHTSTTQHTDDKEYHYHIQNELYLEQYYILFPGDYQGTPSSID